LLAFGCVWLHRYAERKNDAVFQIAGLLAYIFAVLAAIAVVAGVYRLIAKAGTAWDRSEEEQ